MSSLELLQGGERREEGEGGGREGGKYRERGEKVVYKHSVYVTYMCDPVPHALTLAESKELEK